MSKKIDDALNTSSEIVEVEVNNTPEVDVLQGKIN